MNIVLIYLLCLGAILIIPEVGIIFRIRAKKQISADEGIGLKKEINGHDLLVILAKQNRLKNLKITKLQARSTNYYSSRYHVIKLSPITYHSYELSQLSIASHCYRRAKLAMEHTFLYLSYTCIHTLAKTISLIFLPSLICCAIINSFVSSSIPTLILTIILIAYFVSFIIELILYLIKLGRTNSVIQDLKRSTLFEDSELEIVSKQLKCICNLEVFDFTNQTFFIFKLLSPDLIFHQNKKTS